MTLFPLHAKTLSGLEQVLAAELTEFGATDVRPGHRLVTFVGDQRLMYRANLGCRTAIRILKPIANFPADSERALYDGVQQIDWSRFLDPDRSLAIDPVVWSSFCTHSLFVAQLSKDAIVDQFRERTGRRPRVDRNGRTCGSISTWSKTSLPFISTPPAIRCTCAAIASGQVMLRWAKCWPRAF